MFIADLPADGQTLSIQWACCYGISLGPSHITQKREHSGDPVVVAQVAVNSQCFFKEALRSGVLGLNRGDSSCGNKDFGSSGQINGRPLLLQRPGEPLSSFAHVASQVPESAQSACQAQCRFGILFQGPTQNYAHVLVFGTKTLEP